MRFYRWFLESFKSCLLLLVALSGLTDTLAQLLAWLSLLWLSVMWRRRYLTHNHFLRTISLAWSLALHLLFCSAEVFAVEGNKHTHTHTYTHIHTHTNTQTDTFTYLAHVMFSWFLTLPLILIVIHSCCDCCELHFPSSNSHLHLHEMF